MKQLTRRAGTGMATLALITASFVGSGAKAENQPALSPAAVGAAAADVDLGERPQAQAG